MKISSILTLCGSLCVLLAGAQHPCAVQKQRQAAAILQAGSVEKSLSQQTSHELKYDVRFVHLDLQLDNSSKYIAGNVKTVARVTASSLDTFQTVLHPNFTIDSIIFNGQNLAYTRYDSLLKVKAPSPLVNNASFTTQVYYKGMAPSIGGALGDGFSSQPEWYYGGHVTWSLSEPFMAYHWWPCKQILTDKIDSSWVFVTTDSSNRVGSNGLLENVVSLGNKKRYEWKSHSPIDYYLVSVAVAQYADYTIYAKPQYLGGDSIPIQNYVYKPAITDPGWIGNDKVALDKVPAQLEFLSNMYGMYPFYKEKYGHCMAPVPGGMEHQTMTTLGFFDYYVNGHELSHQWWGDNVTCKSWGDIWINEGFASYSEHLIAEYLSPSDFVTNLVAAQNNAMSQPGGSIYFTDTLDNNRIFDSRLTYDKGGAIIHSLRFVTNNDSLWFSTLRGFQQQFKFSTAGAVDFMNYYHAHTGIDPTQFFAQWYYGEGYPTFNVHYNYNGSQVVVKSTQTTSAPSTTLFITPIEFRFMRSGKPDTIIRVMHANPTENYTFNITGSITAMTLDPNQWLMNKTLGPVRDKSLDVGLEEFSYATSFEMMPNPVQNELSILNPASIPGRLYLQDLQGRTLDELELHEVNTIQFQGLASGVYLVVIKNQGGSILQTKKVIK